MCLLFESCVNAINITCLLTKQILPVGIVQWNKHEMYFIRFSNTSTQKILPVGIVQWNKHEMYFIVLPQLFGF